MSDDRTPSQKRSAAKPTTDQKQRVRYAWRGLPCAWCLLPGTWHKGRTGRGHADMTMGHLESFVVVRSYAPQHVAPQCGTCQKATGTRNVRAQVAPGPDWQAVSLRTAQEWAAQGNDPADAPMPTGLADEATRNAARIARLGW